MNVVSSSRVIEIEIPSYSRFGDALTRNYLPLTNPEVRSSFIESQPSLVSRSGVVHSDSAEQISSSDSGQHNVHEVMPDDFSLEHSHEVNSITSLMADLTIGDGEFRMS